MPGCALPRHRDPSFLRKPQHPPLPDTTPPPRLRAPLRDRATLWLVRALLALPFRARVRLAWLLGRWVLGPLSAMRRRTRAAIAHFLPDLPDSEAERIAAEVPGNFARLVIEVLSGPDLARLAQRTPIEGPGWEALQEARSRGRAAILVTAHFGNYDVMRWSLIDRGFPLGGFYKEFPTPALTEEYLRRATAPGQPLFADTPEGLKGTLKHLKGGGMLGILIDLDRENGVLLDFLGKPTRTVLSMAELALRYDALLVPVFAIRTPEGRDGSGFRLLVDAPIPHSDPQAMTLALNDALGAQVRARPEQWVWWHRRRNKNHP